MNPKFAVVFALVAALCNIGADALFFTGATASGGALTLTATSGGAAAGLALAGGLVLIKAAAIAAFAIANSRNNRGGSSRRFRGKRAADEVNEDAAFALIAQVEPEQCYRRLICDLATGQTKSESAPLLVNLFSNNVAISSPKFEFTTAARLGQQLKSIDTCELRYSCSISGEDLAKLL